MCTLSDEIKGDEIKDSGSPIVGVFGSATEGNTHITHYVGVQHVDQLSELYTDLVLT